MVSQRIRQGERGGVSIFIVIFTALLVTIVTASFAQLMVRNQQQAIANDLSQSAYDSALAGVEDAKRALIRLQECENNDNKYADCSRLRSALESDSCNSLGDTQAGVVRFKDGEVQVGDKELNQAYTCVKVQLDTPNYRGDGLAPGVPVVIPLQTKGSVDTVRISWFSKADLDKASSYSAETASFPSGVPPLTLPQSGDEAGQWPTTAPALLRAQLIQFKKGDITLSDFDERGTPNARTLFLYPFNTGSTPGTRDFGDDERRDTTRQNELVPATCSASFEFDGSFACQVILRLPELAGGGEREAYLQLQTYYQQFTSFDVVPLGEDEEPVEFDGVQPQVDSTGRASSLFRRVRASISLRNDGVNLPYPDAALSLNGDLCKNFFVTDDGSEYKPHDNEATDAACSQ